MLVMNVRLHNEKAIPLFCCNVSVLAVLSKLNRPVFLADRFSFKITGVTLPRLSTKLETSLRRTAKAGPEGVGRVLES